MKGLYLSWIPEEKAWKLITRWSEDVPPTAAELEILFGPKRVIGSFKSWVFISEQQKVDQLS